jgi:periplasmic mercuric ion binding protein
MKRSTNILIAAALLTFVGGGLLSTGVMPAANATNSTVVVETQVATFEIENMTCAMCPITVRTAMSRVDGVNSVEVDFESKTAVVNFDPALTTQEAIAQASTDAGYPAFPPGAEHINADGSTHDHSGNQ